MRSIEPTELAVAYELPDWVAWVVQFQTSLVPLQILRAVMDQVLVSMSPLPEDRRIVCPRLDEPSVDDGRSWLPNLQRWLPGPWTNVERADKAVKSDDAIVNMFPWHRRIMLLFPCAPRVLTCLTTLSMRRWRHNIVRSFFAYISRRFGRDWVTRIGLPAGSKRPHGKLCVINPSEACGKVGGRVFNVGFSVSATRINVTKTPRTWICTRIDLEKDLKVGLPII